MEKLAQGLPAKIAFCAVDIYRCSFFWATSFVTLLEMTEILMTMLKTATQANRQLHLKPIDALL